MSLDEAVEKAFRIYEKEQRHPAPVDIVAKHIGYKDAKSGSSLSALATLGYYGLVERPQEGFLAVSADVEAYKYAPSEEIKKSIAVKWLKAPQIFSDLVEKYGSGLPSDGTLQFELIQRGFKPESAAGCVVAFRKSLEFAKFFDRSVVEAPAESHEVSEETLPLERAVDQSPVKGPARAPAPEPVAASDVDRIPVRLSGGRRAWIEVPLPFFAADKERLKAQIDLLLTDDEDESSE